MDKFYGPDIDLKYPEIAISLEKSSIQNPTIKFHIPVLMPTLGDSRIIETNISKQQTLNIINKNNNLNISSCTICNYIISTIPNYLFLKYNTSIDNEYNFSQEFPIGTKFIVIFIGGDINKARIIGLY
jgi:hypothetical protein